MQCNKFWMAALLFGMMAVGSASAATCTLASMNGIYGFITSGYDGSYGAGNVGQSTTNGKGDISGTFTHSVAGKVNTYTFSGTYTMEKNCTGTLDYTVSGEAVHFNFTMDDSSKGLQLTRTDTGYINVGYAIPLGTATCGLSGKTSTFALNLFGGVSGTGNVGYGGQFILNGKGAITGSMTLNLDGTVTSGVAITGTYTQSSNCTGTIQVTPSGRAAQNYATVAVNGNKELLLLETDSGSVVFGTLQ